MRSRSTLKNLLQMALLPVGKTMYVWGGGWNEEDNGAGESAKTIGVSPEWEKFFHMQEKGYDWQQTKFQIKDGLDCSGYIGWCIYNIRENENGRDGYVMPARMMTKEFSELGWGTYRSTVEVSDHQAGDIMSSSGHVYMVVGSCEDGSVVLLHSSPPGVQLCGTTSESGETDSCAVKLAEKYMKTYYPEYYQKYKNCFRGNEYLTDYSQMRWNLSQSAVMSDPDGYRNMTADHILKDLFGE